MTHATIDDKGNMGFTWLRDARNWITIKNLLILKHRLKFLEILCALQYILMGLRADSNSWAERPLHPLLISRSLQSMLFMVRGHHTILLQWVPLTFSSLRLMAQSNSSIFPTPLGPGQWRYKQATLLTHTGPCQSLPPLTRWHWMYYPISRVSQPNML